MDVSVREVRAAGREGLALATQLLQRARRADPQVGLWEAADVQWWWGRPRPSDEVRKLFWVDDEGHVAGVLLTSWADAWQCDPFVELAQRSGFIAGDRDGTAWMDAPDLPAVPALPEGFVVTDRTERRNAPHPMQPERQGRLATGPRTKGRQGRMGRAAFLYHPTGLRRTLHVTPLSVGVFPSRRSIP